MPHDTAARDSRPASRGLRRALLVDLDDTLIVEQPAAEAAFEATARFAAARCPCDAPALALAARECARELWYAAPTHPYCRRIGISSWEGLWCDFDGDGPDLAALRGWSATYRSEAWRTALARQGIQAGDLAAELGVLFVDERRARHQSFPDAAPVLLALRDSWALALVTNGLVCLQLEKLTASGLGDMFDAVVISEQLGVGKPDASVFHHALSQLGVSAPDALMVGDSVERDVDGALAAGLQAVWCNRAGASRPPGRQELVEISSLAELPDVLAQPPAARAPTA